MKKIIIIALFAFAGVTKNICFASDTLFIFFNAANDNQYITKEVKNTDIPIFFTENWCTIEKSCWFKLRFKDSVKTTTWKLGFKHLLVMDSITTNEKVARENAWQFMRALEHEYHYITGHSEMFENYNAGLLEVYRRYNKYGYFTIKRNKLNVKAPNVIDLSTIKTQDQFLELEDKIRTAEIFLIDLEQQRKKNKWIAFKVAVTIPAPVER